MASVRSVLYHNIHDQVSPFEIGLNVSTRLEIFEQHVDYFQKNYDVIDVDTLINGKLPRKPLLITFDDFYRGAYVAARDILRPRGLPSLFFVNPSLVGHEAVSLDCYLSWAVTTHGAAAVCDVLGIAAGPDATAASIIGKVLASSSAARRAEIRADLERALPFAKDDLDRRSPVLEKSDLPLFRDAGVEVGNHTATHVHCGALDATEYAAEIVQSKNDLEAMSGQRVRSFSVAYGHERDLPPPVLKTLRDHGHEALFLVHGRSNASRKAPDIWYRVSLHNEPVKALPMMLSVLPPLRSLKERFQR